ncbi:hypothetical protein [uncultured Mailhella sp.]|uniref:hypothetical protein n=1 Tax=uncultured Mailhella sp. TaxID=1981031 RepID=UPI002636304E|nr:hypothetical protein [uncultured Mailhella sp.]
MSGTELRLSPLAHTWLFDFDGTLVVHNGYKSGRDEWLPGALEFLKSLPEGDTVIILTARERAAREKTEAFLRSYGVRYDHLFFEIPVGERILLNDCKPSGLPCAYAVRPVRNQGLAHLSLVIDENL